jgi:hypothetical protein
MNEELEPMGLPTSQESKLQSLRDLVSQHPLAALAASAAVGAGVMALIAAVSARRDASPMAALNSQAGDTYSDLRDQLGKLVDRLSGAVPSKDTISQTASDFGAEASKVIDKASDAAKRTFRSATEAGWNATEAAKAHPLITSLVLGAIGTVLASLGTAAKKSSDAGTEANTDDGDKSGRWSNRPTAPLAD